MERDEIRERIRTSISCLDYLGERTQGGGYICSCGSGTGKNRTGARMYYEHTNTWHCFSCGKSGDVIDLMQEKNGYDFNAALEDGARQLGLPFNRENGYTNKAQDFNDSSKAASKSEDKKPSSYQNQMDFYIKSNETLTASMDNPGRAYLAQRGLDEQAIILHQLGLYTDSMGNQRLLIPLDMAAYTGRIIESKENAPKYMNSKGTGARLFNKAAIEDAGKEPVIICEGAFDAMSAEAAGFNAISLQSCDNGKLLLEYLDEKEAECSFVICFDYDSDEKTRASVTGKALDLKAELEARQYRCEIMDISKYLKPGEKDINDIWKRDRKENTDTLKDALKAEADFDDVTDFFKRIQSEAYKPYTSNVSFIDDLMGGGFIAQQLYLLMASPATGKTTLCQQIAEEMATHKKKVIYLNLEMSREQMLAKAFSYQLAKDEIYLSTTEILQGYKWDDETRGKIEKELKDYREKVLPYIKYNPDKVGNDLDEIKKYLTRVGEAAKKRGEDAPALILDYLHLVTAKTSKDAAELIKDAVAVLKQYAIDYHTFVIAISATNRMSAQAGKITMQSGRDSSSIEYTGDAILSLEYYLLDKKVAHPGNLDELSDIQHGDENGWRHLILRSLKTRFGEQGKTERVYYLPKYNIFYGENDWLPEDNAPIDFDRAEAIFKLKHKSTD